MSDGVCRRCDRESETVDDTGFCLFCRDWLREKGINPDRIGDQSELLTGKPDQRRSEKRKIKRGVISGKLCRFVLNVARCATRIYTLPCPYVVGATGECDTTTTASAEASAVAGGVV